MYPHPFVWNFASDKEFDSASIAKYTFANEPHIKLALVASALEAAISPAHFDARTRSFIAGG
jgi:hypothetical protein